MCHTRDVHHAIARRRSSFYIRAMNSYPTVASRSLQLPLPQHFKWIEPQERDDEWEKFLAVGLEVRIAQAELVATWERKLALLAY